MAEMRREDFEALLRFRTALRHFLHWSEDEARAAGLTPAQHQLLLAIKGHPGEDDPTVGDVAEHLVLKHHSAVELVGRAVDSGLVLRERDAADHRVVRLRLTPLAERRIDDLSRLHLEELRGLARRWALP